MRVCSSANGSDARRSSHARISPSSTVPSGSARRGSTISGKRSVTSSSPRDQRKTSPARRISCARMPSHFHSACQSRDVAERLAAAARAARRGRTDRAAEVGRRRRRRARAALRRTPASAASRPSGGARCVARGSAADLRQRAHHQELRHADAEAAGDELVPARSARRRPAGATQPITSARCSASAARAAAGSAPRPSDAAAAVARWPPRRSCSSSAMVSAGRRRRRSTPRTASPAGRVRSAPSRAAPPRDSRLRRCPVRKNTAQAASCGRRRRGSTRPCAATFALVLVVASRPRRARRSAHQPRRRRSLGVVDLALEPGLRARARRGRARAGSAPRVGVAVRRAARAGTGRLDRSAAGRPVGVVGEDEAAVEAAPAAVAAHPHPARGERGARRRRSGAARACRGRAAARDQRAGEASPSRPARRPARSAAADARVAIGTASAPRPRRARRPAGRCARPSSASTRWALPSA